MSRSGYHDDCDGWDLIRWRGAVKSALQGYRGQAFLNELAQAMDAMPDKRLIANELQDADGDFCALGVIGAARGVDMKAVDPEDRERVAQVFNIAPAMAAEIVFMNDEAFIGYEYVTVDICGPVRPHFPDWGRKSVTVRMPVSDAAAARWKYMRDWVQRQLDARAAKSQETNNG